MNTQQNAPQAPTEAAPSAAKSIEQRMSEMENNNTRMLTLMEAMMTRLVSGASAGIGAGPASSKNIDARPPAAPEPPRIVQDARSTLSSSEEVGRAEEDVSDVEVRKMLKSGKALSHLRHAGDFTFHIERKPRLMKNKDGKWYPNFAGESFERVDMICTASAAGYEPRCSARRYIDRDPATGEVLGSQDIGEHTAHGRKNRSRADPDVLAHGKRLLASGVPPAQAEMLLAKRARAEGPGACTSSVVRRMLLMTSLNVVSTSRISRMEKLSLGPID